MKRKRRTWHTKNQSLGTSRKSGFFEAKRSAKIDEVYEQHWSTIRNNGLTIKANTLISIVCLRLRERNERNAEISRHAPRELFSPAQRSLHIRVFVKY